MMVELRGTGAKRKSHRTANLGKATGGFRKFSNSRRDKQKKEETVPDLDKLTHTCTGICVCLCVFE
jgi:hypothetical protein